MSRSLRLVYYLIVLLMLSSVLSWFTLGRLWFMPVSLIVGHLEQTLPWVETHSLTAYRNQSWCKNIAYKSGAFSQTSNPSTCNLFNAEAQSFSPEARADFQSLRQKLRLTGARVAFIYAYETSWVEFHLNCLWCSRTRYVYQPGYVLPNHSDNEIWYQPLTQNWYQVNEDWN